MDIYFTISLLYLGAIYLLLKGKRKILNESNFPFRLQNGIGCFNSSDDADKCIGFSSDA